MIDYEDLILQRQEMMEIWEDEPDSAECPMVTAGGMTYRRRNLYVNILK